MTLYRPHRGSLDAAMAEIATVDGLPSLVQHMRDTCPSFYPEDERPTLDNVKIEPYGFDARIGWDTHIVTVKGNAWGFTNGPVT